MGRTLKPSAVSTALPALAALLAACNRESRTAPAPPPPGQPDTTSAQDAGAPQHPVEPVHVDPHNVPMHMGGAVMVVSPRPAPSAMAAPAAPSAAAAAAPAAERAPGVYVVHNHPQGTPCRPLSHTEVRQAAERVATP